MRKKLDKRICRKYADPSYRFSPSNGIFYLPDIQYVVRAAVKNIGSRRTLVLYLYASKDIIENRFVPTFTVFQTKEDFITLEMAQDGSSKWLASPTGSLQRDYRFESKCAFYSKGDNDTVVRYCDNKWQNGFDALSRLQDRLKGQAELENMYAKERKIIKRMKVVPALPRGFSNWVSHSVIPHYIFYDYDRKGPVNGYCTACQQNVKATAAKHNKTGVCPHCKSQVTFKCRSRRGNLSDKKTAQVIQRVGENEMLIRIVKTYVWYSGQDVPQISLRENARLFCGWDGQKITKEEPFYFSYSKGILTHWVKGFRPVFSHYQYSFEADTCGHLYPKNLDDALGGTPWKYSQLKTYSQKEPDPFYLLDYLKEYLRYPVIEYLVKLRLYRLASYAVYGDGYYRYNHIKPIDLGGKNIKEVLGLDKRYLPLLQEVNPGSRQMLMIKAFLREGVQPHAELLKWCGEVGVGDAGDVSTALCYMTPHKLMQYADEQFAKHRKKNFASPGYANMATLLSDYCDYLSMCSALDYDLQNSFVLYPRSLPEAHNWVNDLSDTDCAEAYDRAIAKAFSPLQKRYQFENRDYMVVPPHSAQEIVTEGQKLHHCVGRYVKNVVRHECIILFIREKAAPEKPYCTVELKQGAIVQARVYDNESPPFKVNHFIEQWKQKVLYAPIQEAA